MSRGGSLGAGVAVPSTPNGPHAKAALSQPCFRVCRLLPPALASGRQADRIGSVSRLARSEPKETLLARHMSSNSYTDVVITTRVFSLPSPALIPTEGVGNRRANTRTHTRRHSFAQM